MLLVFYKSTKHRLFLHKKQAVSYFLPLLLSGFFIKGIGHCFTVVLPWFVFCSCQALFLKNTAKPFPKHSRTKPEQNPSFFCRCVNSCQFVSMCVKTCQYVSICVIVLHGFRNEFGMSYNVVCHAELVSASRLGLC